MKYLALFIFSVSCGGHPGLLTKKARNLDVYPSKPSKCRVMGKVIGVDKTGTSELAVNHALNQAADLGASGIFVNEEIPNGKNRTVHATAYECN